MFSLLLMLALFRLFITPRCCRRDLRWHRVLCSHFWSLLNMQDKARDQLLLLLQKRCCKSIQADVRRPRTRSAANFGHLEKKVWKNWKFFDFLQLSRTITRKLLGLFLIWEMFWNHFEKGFNLVAVLAQNSKFWFGVFWLADFCLFFSTNFLRWLATFKLAQNVTELLSIIYTVYYVS